MNNPKLLNTEAEASIVGALLLKPAAYHQIAAEIEPEDFAIDANRIIFEVITRMIMEDQAIDVVTVSEEVERIGKSERVGGMTYIGTTANNVPGASNIKSYARIVRRCSERRKLINAFSLLTKQLQGGAEPIDVVAEAGISLDGVSRRGVSKSIDFITAMDRTVKQLGEAEKNKQNGIVGVSTGLNELDRRLGGFMPSRLIAVAARPSIGKTAFVNQVGLYASTKGVDVGICSLEMGLEELVMRSAANRYKINFSALIHSNKTAIKAFEKAIGEDNDLANTALHFDTETFSLPGIVARITEWKRKHDIGMAIIDHIGLIEGRASKESVNDWLGTVSRTFKKLSKKLNIPVVIVCQLNRSVEREKRRPRLSDLRDSGSIEQDIDIGLFLHTESPDDALIKQMEIGILKNRQGAKGWLEFYEFQGAYQRFIENPHSLEAVA